MSNLNFFNNQLEWIGKVGVSLTQSEVEARSRILISTNNLIDAVLERVEGDFNKVSKLAMLERPIIIQRISSKKVEVEDNKIIDGSVEVLCTVSSFSPYRKSARITLTYPIQFGQLKNANYLKTSTGAQHSFNEAGIKKALKIRNFYAPVISTRKGNPVSISAK